MTFSQNQVLYKAIGTYGEEAQLTVATEELSELIKEICKHKRGADNKENIIEEVADCYIMLRQIEMIIGFNFEQVNEVIKSKIDRLQERIEREE